MSKIEARILEDHEDGLILYFLTDSNKYASIEWFNSGEIILLMCNRDNDEIIVEDITNIPTALRCIKDYIK